MPSHQIELCNVEAFYDEFGSTYGISRLNKGLLFNDYIERPALRSLIQDVKKGRRKTLNRVLDIGCGPGIYTKDLVGSGNNVTALDISKEMLNMAKRFCQDSLNEDSYNKIEFVHSSFQAFDSKKIKYDLILATFMLSYFHDLDVFFKKIHNILDTQGKVITSMLHPMRMFNGGEESGKNYVISEYFNNGFYDSDFINDDTLFPLKRWRLEEISCAAFENGLLIEKILEPIPTLILPEEYKEKSDFFRENPSLIMFMLRRK